jgi:hypothetical protein
MKEKVIVMKRGRTVFVIMACFIFLFGSSQTIKAETSMPESKKIFIEYRVVDLNWGEEITTISGDGSLQAEFKKLISFDGSPRTHKKRNGKLSEAEMADLIEFVIKQHKFFELPEDFIPPRDLRSDGDEYLTVVFQGKKHKSGGCFVEDDNFRQIANKLYHLKLKFPEVVLPAEK